jgi:hypothetical protein
MVDDMKKQLKRLLLLMVIGGVVATVVRTVRARSVAESATTERSSNAKVDEWGRESFPASDPPANY